MREARRRSDGEEWARNGQVVFVNMCSTWEQRKKRGGEGGEKGRINYFSWPGKFPRNSTWVVLTWYVCSRKTLWYKCRPCVSVFLIIIIALSQIKTCVGVALKGQCNFLIWSNLIFNRPGGSKALAPSRCLVNARQKSIWASITCHLRLHFTWVSLLIFWKMMRLWNEYQLVFSVFFSGVWRRRVCLKWRNHLNLKHKSWNAYLQFHLKPDVFQSLIFLHFPNLKLILYVFAGVFKCIYLFVTQECLDGFWVDFIKDVTVDFGGQRSSSSSLKGHKHVSES